MSQDEFALRFKERFRSLWAIALGLLGDATAAEDVVQEAAVVALRKLDQFQEGTSFVAWMAQIVRFVSLNRARKREATAAENDELDRAAPVVAPAPALRLGARGQLPSDQQAFDDQVAAGLAGLSDVARACLLLRAVDGLEYSEIAATLSIPANTAMSHVHRARAHLRRALGEARAPGGMP